MRRRARTREEWHRQADIIQAFIAGVVTTMVVVLAITELLRYGQ
jgi:hypothetical protein